VKERGVECAKERGLWIEGRGFLIVIPFIIYCRRFINEPKPSELEPLPLAMSLHPFSPLIAAPVLSSFSVDSGDQEQSCQVLNIILGAFVALTWWHLHMRVLCAVEGTETNCSLNGKEMGRNCGKNLIF